jgi:uncharacterized integral membrane protein
MDIVIEKLFPDQERRSLSIPGFFVRSTAPTNVEDECKDIVDKDLPTIADVIELLYQQSLSCATSSSLVIAVHGYNTGTDDSGRDGVLEGWYQPMCTYANEDPFIQAEANHATFLGFRWPSESLKQKKLRHEAFRALPLLLRWVFCGGAILAIVFSILLFLVSSDLPVILVILGSVLFATILCMFLLRISLYFRDSYRATYFGVPDFVELIRQLDKGLVNRRIQESLTEDTLCDRIVDKLPACQSLDRAVLLKLVQAVQQSLDYNPDMVLDTSDPQFNNLLLKLDHIAPDSLSVETLTEMVQRIVLIKSLEMESALRYWQKNPVKLSIMGHSMGAHVSTQVIRILSDIFDSRSVGALGTGEVKTPPPRIGRVFSLGRLILVSPDIPVLTITSGRANFLRSALRRFEEAYLFSNEGDLALRIASTAANYFSFPARSRTQGYRLGNVTVKHKASESGKPESKAGFGIVNLAELPKLPAEHLLPYLELSILSKGKGQSLDPETQLRVKQQTLDEETVTSVRPDKEAIADLFTYFDCTEYRDRTDYNDVGQKTDANVMILDGQKPPLRFWGYVRLFWAYATFSPRKFPAGGRDVHGGYFWGRFSKLLLYRLAFLGFGGLLDSLINTTPEELSVPYPLPDDLATELSKARSLPSPNPAEPIVGMYLPDPSNLTPAQERRRIALKYLSWLCQQKYIQVAVSSERYHVDVLGRQRDEVRVQITTQS